MSVAAATLQRSLDCTWSAPVYALASFSNYQLGIPVIVIANFLTHRIKSRITREWGERADYRAWPGLRALLQKLRWHVFYLLFTFLLAIVLLWFMRGAIGAFTLNPRGFIAEGGKSCIMRRRKCEESERSVSPDAYSHVNQVRWPHCERENRGRICQSQWIATSLVSSKYIAWWLI